MDKSKIPLVKFTIKDGEQELVVSAYSWLTVEEEDEYLLSVLGGTEIVPGQESNVVLTADKISKAREFTVKSLCQSLTWEEYGVLSPSQRDEIYQKLVEIRDKKK